MNDFYERLSLVAMTIFFSFGSIFIAINSQNLSLNLFNYNKIISNPSYCHEIQNLSINDSYDGIIEITINNDIKDFKRNTYIIYTLLTFAVLSGFIHLFIVCKRNRT